MEAVDEASGAILRNQVRRVQDVSAGYTAFQDRDVLFAKITPCMENGKVAIADNLVGHVGFGSTEFHVIRAKDGYLPEWIYFYLRRSETRQYAERFMTGTAGQKRVPPRFMQELQIPVPDLPPTESLAEQRRIAAILSAADGERRRRLYIQSAHSDRFAQDLFVEMFGDPATNPMEWDVDTIRSVVATSQYGTSEKSNDLGLGYPVLGMANVTYAGNLDLSHVAFVNLSRRAFTSLRLEPGDIIFNRTNSTELVGKTAVWTLNFDAVLASYLVRLRLKAHMRAEYFSALMNTPYYKELFRRRCKKAVGQSNISPTLLQEFPLMIPPKSLQDKYAERVAEYGVARMQQSELGRQTDHLFQSLLDRAFRGEL